MKMVRLSEWAESQGIALVTAYRWHRAGVMPVPTRKIGGLIFVEDPQGERDPGLTVVYAQVATAAEKAGLDEQVARVTKWATGNGMHVDRVVTEVGPTASDGRHKFQALLGDPDVSTIVVEHRDRFARFGAGYIEAALTAQGRRLIAVDDQPNADPEQDLAEVLTVLCAQRYGKRSAAARARRMIQAAAGIGGPS